MNRTYLEGAVQALATERGYTFHTGPESDMTHSLRSYPAAWLSPLKMSMAEGRHHGRVTYELTLHLLCSGSRLSPSQRCAAQAAMEEQLLDLFAALSLEKRVLAVAELTIEPRTFALTPHGELSQSAQARIATWF